MSSHKILKIARPDPARQNNLSRGLGISRILSQLLINRGITDPAEAEEFLKIDLDNLLDPFLFSDMPQALKLIKEAARRKAKVLVFGDYDVDGITSIALLKNTLAKEGLETLHHIPHRVKDGYGLNKSIINIVKQKHIRLLITADCGISSFAEIKELRSNNVEVIVTDHHEPAQSELPPASAILNPKVKKCNYKFKELAGVGVAYKLCQALTGKKLAEDLDLVSLGTIADVVPLTGENRIIAKEGLSRLTRSKRIGIRALIEVSRLGQKEINATFVSFIIGPRINASGRMDTAETALKLLMSQDKVEADTLARAIDNFNRQRQKIEASILEEAQAIVEREINFKEHKIIVIAQEGWHQGVLGIVASKLADRFYRPTIVISLGQEFCKGSGRSIKNFHLFSALTDCKQYLKSFGGHGHAVGLVVERNNLEDFKKQINQLAKNRLSLEDLLPSLEIDMQLELSELSEELVEEIALLEPFGTANPQPLFYTPNLRLKGAVRLLSRDTLKFWVTDGVNTYPAIGFGMGSFRESLLSAENLELVYTPKLDNWQDHKAIILEVQEMFFK